MMPKYRITYSKYKVKYIRASSLAIAEERAKKLETPDKKTETGWEATEVRLAPEE